MGAGRPRKWNSKEELQSMIDKYWEYCEEYNKPMTIAGLAYYTNVDRQTIYNYAKNEEYFDTIKKARDRIMLGLEEIAIEKGNAGTIFVMKNYGYKDKQEIDHSSNDVANVTKAFLNSMKE